jgi:hypothetical protein
MSQYDRTIIELVESATRTMRVGPLVLGGGGGEGGGVGTPPGGVVGQLPQYRVSYDTTEAETLDTLPSGVAGISGWSLVDNLNHIRYRIGQLESGSGVVSSGITITDDNTSNIYDNTTNLRFIGSGVVVTDLGGGDVQVTINATGSGGSGTLDGYGWHEYAVTAVSADVATYYYLEKDSPDRAGFAAGVSGSDYLAASLITQTPALGVTAISDAVVKISGSAYADIGGISVDTYAKLYKRNSGGTETLLSTSNTVNISTESYYTLSFTGTYTISLTDRIVLKIYGTVIGGVPSYCYINLSLGTTPLTVFSFKATYGQISSIYFNDEFNTTTVSSGLLTVDFDDERLKYKYLKLDTDAGNVDQYITRQLLIFNDISGEGVIYGYSTGDAYTAEFDQITVTDNVTAPLLYLYQETDSAVNSGIMLYGYRTIDSTGSFDADLIKLEDDFSVKFKVDKDGNVDIPVSSTYKINGVPHSHGTTPAFTASNVTTDRTFDANSTSIDELADILGTLIQDLKNLGIVG